MVTLYTQGIRERVQCLHAGFSPEHRIFLRRHAIQASGSRLRSLPALVFISLHEGLSSLSAVAEFGSPPASSRVVASWWMSSPSCPVAGSAACVLPKSRELAWLWVSKSSRRAAGSSWANPKLAPGVFNGESSESGGIMTGAGTPGSRPGASFGAEAGGRRGERPQLEAQGRSREMGKRLKVRGDRKKNMRQSGGFLEERNEGEYGERFSGEWWLGTDLSTGNTSIYYYQ